MVSQMQPGDIGETQINTAFIILTGPREGITTALTPQVLSWHVLATLASLNYKLHLLNSESPPDSPWVFISATWYGDSLKAILWGKQKAHLICFPYFRNYCPSLPDLQCHENHFFIYFVHFFGFLGLG